MLVDILIMVAIAAASILLVWALFMIERFRSQRHVIENQLHDSEARSRAVTESMSEGVITTAPDGMIVDVNNGALQMFGYDRLEMIGRNVTHLVPERHREFFAGMIERLASRPDNLREEEREARGLRRDGVELYVRVSFADIREHMDVYGSCGNFLGKVDHVEGDSIKLTKSDSPDTMDTYCRLPTR